MSLQSENLLLQISVTKLSILSKISVYTQENFCLYENFFLSIRKKISVYTKNFVN